MDDPDTWGTPAGQAMIELLWNPPSPPARGPKQRLTLDAVVAAATELARRGDGAELSMRKVAQHLGVGTMSLYTYVPGRDELLELMVDHAWASRELPGRDLSWRAQVEFHARQAWLMYEREPWMLHANRWRLPLGPHVLDVQEDLYRAVALTGLAPATLVRVRALVESHVFGAARALLLEVGMTTRTGVSWDDYWDSRAGFWATYYTPERFPTMTRIWGAGGFDHGDVENSWEFGLGLLLDGVERLAATEPGAAT